MPIAQGKLKVFARYRWEGWAQVMPNVADAYTCPRCKRGKLQPQGDYVWKEGKAFHTGVVEATAPPITVRAAACNQCGFVELYKEPS